jgi:hypothetical protein
MFERDGEKRDVGEGTIALELPVNIAEEYLEASLANMLRFAMKSGKYSSFMYSSKSVEWQRPGIEGRVYMMRMHMNMMMTRMMMSVKMEDMKTYRDGIFVTKSMQVEDTNDRKDPMRFRGCVASS